MDETLGQKIKRLREDKGLSQSALARLLGVAPQAVQKWEGTGVPRMQRLEAIAAVLGVTAAYLMEDAAASGPAIDGWPFEFPRSRFDALPDKLKGRAEERVLAVIEEWEANHSKRPTAKSA